MPGVPFLNRSRAYEVGIHADPGDTSRRPLRRIARIAGLTVAVLWVGFLIAGFVLIAVSTNDPKLKAPILALYRDDGLVVAEVLACGTDQVRSFYIDAAGNQRWSVLADPRRTDAPPVSTIPLFQVPQGWNAAGEEPFLSNPALAPDGRYLVWLRTERGDQAAFTFLTSQLDGTNAGTVLTVTDDDDATDDDGDPLSTLVPRAEFDRRGAAYCQEHP